MRVLFIFLDGVGLGIDDPNINPFARLEMPFLQSLLGGNKLLANSAPYVGRTCYTSFTRCYARGKRIATIRNWTSRFIDRNQHSSRNRRTLRTKAKPGGCEISPQWKFIFTSSQGWKNCGFAQCLSAALF